jgi:uncharacterized alpha/beta hydrolase family protein
MRINLSALSSNSKQNKWLTNLMREFAEEYEITFGNKIKQYFGTPSGARAFAAWLKDSGYRVNYWALEPLTYRESYNSSKVTEYLGFGIIFDDACPKFIEIKLKS